jgi:hypothetical protein
LCAVDRRRDRDPLGRRSPEPGARGEVAVEDHAQERVGVALRDPPDDFLDERTPVGRPEDEHLPAGLHVDARVDEELGELTISRVGHGG